MKNFLRPYGYTDRRVNCVLYVLAQLFLHHNSSFINAKEDGICLSISFSFLLSFMNKTMILWNRLRIICSLYNTYYFLICFFIAEEGVTQLLTYISSTASQHPYLRLSLINFHLLWKQKVCVFSFAKSNQIPYSHWCCMIHRVRAVSLIKEVNFVTLAQTVSALWLHPLQAQMCNEGVSVMPWRGLIKTALISTLHRHMHFQSLSPVPDLHKSWNLLKSCLDQFATVSPMTLNP